MRRQRRGTSLRAAFVIDAVGPWSVGGRESRYAELFRRLPDDGVEVTVYSMKWWSTPPTGPITYKAITPLLPLYRAGRRSTLHAVLFALGSLRLLGARVDVIQADQMPYLHLFPLRLIAWIRRVPLVVDWHEFWGEAQWEGYVGHGARMAARVERVAARLPDVVVPGSASLVQPLERAGARCVQIVSNALDRERLAAVEASTTSPTVIVVGRLIEHKRVDLALRAFAGVRRARATVTLGIVGDGPERSRLEALSDELGLDESAAFLGSLEDQEDLWSLIGGSAVLLFPSEREGFGLTVAEALALGTPVVCVDGQGSVASHLVAQGETGSIVSAGSVDELVAATVEWIDARADRGAVSASFWTSHPSMDWEVSARRYADVLSAAARAA